jgi:hypothetical protein
MSAVTTSQAFATLKATLEEIVTDDSDGYEKKTFYKQYMKVEGMKDNYIDDLSNGGPGLATEKAEGQALDVMGLSNGYQTRYTSRKHGLIMQITEELDEDGKYNDEYVDAARRMKRAVFKSMEVDCAQILNRVHNSAYVGGDGLCLGSASHTIPGGGTFSNTLSTAFSPSRAALIVVRQNLMTMPGWDGVTEGYMPTKVVCPPAQWGAWAGILGSDKVPESGNNEINVAADMGLGKPVAVPYWSASTTNWLVLTDAAKLKLKIRRKPKSRTWYDEPTEVINYGISARWARGWSDPRAVYTSNA